MKEVWVVIRGSWAEAAFTDERSARKWKSSKEREQEETLLKMGIDVEDLPLKRVSFHIDKVLLDTRPVASESPRVVPCYKRSGSLYPPCTCPQECDCEDFEGGLVSNLCPEHNYYPVVCNNCKANIHWDNREQWQ